MKDVAGSPGTWSGLALRLSQCLYVGASKATTLTAHGSYSYTAYIYLNISMEVQFFWSFILACIDILSLMSKKDLHSPFHVWPLLVGDWFMGVNSFAAFAAATGAIIYFERDAHFCRVHPDLACDQYELSTCLAFMAWSFVAASATSLFWLLASFY